MLPTKLAFLVAFLAACIFQAAALAQDPMGVTAGATWCLGLDKVQNSGFDSKKPMIAIPSFTGPKNSADRRPRWSVNIPDVHGAVTALQVNRDASGNWQNHLKLHQNVKNWTGNLIVKASYPGGANGAKVDHFFVIGMDDAAGCVLTTTAAPGPKYSIDWSYQLNGHKLRRE